MDGKVTHGSIATTSLVPPDPLLRGWSLQTCPLSCQSLVFADNKVQMWKSHSVTSVQCQCKLKDKKWRRFWKSLASFDCCFLSYFQLVVWFTFAALTQTITVICTATSLSRGWWPRSSETTCRGTRGWWNTSQPVTSCLSPWDNSMLTLTAPHHHELVLAVINSPTSVWKHDLCINLWMKRTCS